MAEFLFTGSANSDDLPRGYSAYEVAVQGGYTGTVNQWLTSLKGPAGPSAYEVAVTGGYVGTVAEWLASLKGEPGAAATITFGKGMPGEPSNAVAPPVLGMTVPGSIPYLSLYATREPLLPGATGTFLAITSATGNRVGYIKGIAVVEHGTVASTARPPFPVVYWKGTVRPTNGLPGDLHNGLVLT